MWWWTSTDEERAFYCINTPTQIILIVGPPLWMDDHGALIEQWYQNNPQLFDMLVLPILFGWVATFFVVRWLIGKTIELYYSYKEIDL